MDNLTRLLDRKVVNVLCQIPEKNKFLRGLVEWVGFRQIGISYVVNERKIISKFSLKNYLTLLLMVFFFSTAPLRVFLY